MKILQYYNDVIRQPYVYKRIVTDQQYIIRIDDESYIYLYFVQEDKHFVKFAVVAKKTQTGYHIVNISSYDGQVWNYTRPHRYNTGLYIIIAYDLYAYTINDNDGMIDHELTIIRSYLECFNIGGNKYRFSLP